MKSQYVDGFVLLVPKKNLKAYQKMAKAAGKIWKEHGAIDYKECVGEDMKTKMGIPFPKLAGSKASEVVIFSWITYKSKSHRNSVNKKVMTDPRIQKLGCEGAMPFDMNRMSYGGFKVIVDHG